MKWYLKNQVKSNRVLNKVATHASCYVKILMTLDEPRTGGLATESLNGGGTGITSDDNSLIFELLSLLLKNGLSRGVFCEDLDDC